VQSQRVPLKLQAQAQHLPLRELSSAKAFYAIFPSRISARLFRRPTRTSSARKSELAL
jgi:hypothetical protein